HVFYIGGGNPFYLLEKMKDSGADKIITELSKQNRIIIGVSAGSLILGPHLKVVEYFTPGLKLNTNQIDKGFSLFSFAIMPHYDREDIFPAELSIEDRLRALEEQLDEK